MKGKLAELAWTGLPTIMVAAACIQLFIIGQQITSLLTLLTTLILVARIVRVFMRKPYDN